MARTTIKRIEIKNGVKYRAVKITIGDDIHLRIVDGRIFQISHPSDKQPVIHRAAVCKKT